MKYYYSFYQSPIGKYILTSDGDGLNGVWMDEQKYILHNMKGAGEERDNLPIFAATKKWLDEYFTGKNPSLSKLKLSPEGGEFRQMVWDILLKIPYGGLTTYGDIAKQVAKKMGRKQMSAQAVGGAVGHNPISIIIPCHRVVGTNGSLTGYAGGIDVKIKLLNVEGVDVSRFTMPK